MNNKRFALVKIFVGVFVLSFLSATINADNPVSPNWNINDIGTQIRSLTTNYSGTAAVIGGASILGNASSNSIIINGLNVSTENDPTAAYDNGTDIIAGGAAYNHQANSNNVQILNGSTIQGRSIFGGAAFLRYPENRFDNASASSNNILIKDSTVLPSSLYTGGLVFGSYVQYGNGKGNDNTITIDNSSITGSVFGSYVVPTFLPIDYDDDGSLVPQINTEGNNNTVNIINGSSVSGMVVGNWGPGGEVKGNTVVVDNSYVNMVGGAINEIAYFTEDTTTSESLFENNSVKILNGSNVNLVNVIEVFSANANKNSLEIDSSTVGNGYLRTVLVELGVILHESGDPTPINADISSNSLSINNMPTASLYELGAGLNLAGKSDDNKTTLSNLSNLTIDRSNFSFGVLQLSRLSPLNVISVPNLSNVVVSTNNFNDDYGFIYGGVSLEYTAQMNNLDDGEAGHHPQGGVLPPGADVVPDVNIVADVEDDGGSANNNTVSIKDSTVNANIIGGFAGQIQAVDYTNWSGDSSGTTKQKTFKVGRRIHHETYSCDADGANCVLTSSEVEDEDVEYDSKPFTANNNTVILDNVNLDGVVYGGYVIGADLKLDDISTANNKVIIRGATTLSDDSVIYGGNAFLDRSTNKLIFDHVAGAGGTYITYNNINQFKNFNKVWGVNADLDTRINFNMNNVEALVSVDTSNQQEGSATIIKTQTTSDLSDVEQNGVISDITDNSIELAQAKNGAYSYTLVGTKEDATTIGWLLTSVKDHQNVEIYGQVPLVGLALAAEGPDMLSKALGEAWQSNLEVGTFFDAAYHHTRYHTGSGFDLDSGILQAGFWKKLSEETLAGLFVKYSFGNYETFPIKATGNANAYGGGLMISRKYSQTGRFEANVEVGYLDMEFKSNQLNSVFDTKGMYYGALFGVVEDVAPNCFAFVNLQFLRKGKDSMTDNLNQSINYEAMQSLALRAGGEASFPTLAFAEIVPSLGLSALYEFDGKSKLDVAGMGNDEASMKGLSGRGEIAFTYDSENGPFPLISKFTIFGLAGKRSGFGGELNFAFKF